jgi:hypothetical protein
MDVNRTNQHWKVYRSKLLIKAKQLTYPLTFVDALGREHRGQPGDYLMEWSKGLLRIVPQEFFEDAYIPLKSTNSGKASGQLNGRTATKHPYPVGNSRTDAPFRREAPRSQ